MKKEEAREFARAIWTYAANAFRLYPDNKHTFADYWANYEHLFDKYCDKEPKFKDGDYIIHPEDGFCKITNTSMGHNNNLYWTYKKTDGFIKHLNENSLNYIDSRLATKEEIEANTLIKLEVGDYIHNPEFGIAKVISKNLYPWTYELKTKDEMYVKMVHGETWHRQSKLATSEQIAAFKNPWNEGIEEAKKYKDGQACLVTNDLRISPLLSYSDGKGNFYERFQKSGATYNPKYHLPLNEQTIKNLPVNE